jgi:hypothetical protein
MDSLSVSSSSFHHAGPCPYGRDCFCLTHADEIAATVAWLAELKNRELYPYVVKKLGRDGDGDGDGYKFNNDCLSCHYTNSGEYSDADPYAQYHIPSTGADRSDPVLLTAVLLGFTSGLEVVESVIPPHLVSFFGCCGGGEHVDYVEVWETHESELRSLGVPHYLDSVDSHPPSKCSYFCQWPTSRHVLQKFRDQQAAGNFSYALSRDYDSLHVGALSCVYFSKLEEFPRLSAVIRSDPCLLTHISMCGGHNGHIVSSVHPDHVVFHDLDLHFGPEAIDQDESQSNVERAQ